MVSTTTSGAGHVSIGQRMRTVLPILTWGRTYPRRWLRADLVAGVTVAAFAIPEDMAYASMAGLQPQHGLYASLVSLLVYAAVGTSRQLAYGGTSALAIMLAGTLGAMTFTGPDQYLAAASLVAVLSGAMALVAWTLRLGFIANFVSESVLTGFSAGAALYIASSQLPKLFGIEGVQGNFFERVWNVLRHLGDTNGWSLGLGLLSLGLLLFLEARFHRLPTALIVVVAAILVSWSTGLEDKGVAVAGKIPGGLPTPALPAIPADQLPQLVSLAFGAFLLSYIEGIGAAKTFAARYRERIDSNQELFANGVANIGAGLFQGYTVGGSMSRSAVNDSAGSKTPLAGAIASAVVGLVLLFLTAPFSHLPETTLAAIVFVAVRGLVNIPNIRALWHTSRGEFLAAAAAFGGVLVFGMLEGIIIGVLVTFVTILMRLSKPETSVLGLRPGTTDFV
ncbi:MAG: SulP family inorganic anion transporter, partial [Thermomicrobiales bacterium]